MHEQNLFSLRRIYQHPLRKPVMTCVDLHSPPSDMIQISGVALNSTRNPFILCGRYSRNRDERRRDERRRREPERHGKSSGEMYRDRERERERNERRRGSPRGRSRSRSRSSSRGKSRDREQRRGEGRSYSLNSLMKSQMVKHITALETDFYGVYACSTAEVV